MDKLKLFFHAILAILNRYLPLHPTPGGVPSQNTMLDCGQNRIARNLQDEIAALNDRRRGSELWRYWKSCGVNDYRA